MEDEILTVDTEDEVTREILVGSKFKITGSSLQWIVEYYHKHDQTDKRVKTDGHWTIMGYYPSLSWACQSILEHKLKEEYVGELKGIIAFIEASKKEIIEAVGDR
jgi:hypothetical protein